MSILAFLMSLKILLGQLLFFGLIVILGQCTIVIVYFLFIRKTPRMAVPFFIIALIASMVELILLSG